MSKHNVYEVFVTFGSTDMFFAPSSNKSKLLSNMFSAIRGNLLCGSHTSWWLYENGNEIVFGTVYKDYNCRFTFTRSDIL